MARKATKAARRTGRTRRGSFTTTLKVRGFMRVQVVDAKTGHVLGDSGVRRNIVVNEGKNNYIVKSVGGISAAKSITHLALATQNSVAAASDGTVAGEQGGRKLLTDTSDPSSNRKVLQANGTLQMVASWAGSDLGVASPKTIASIAAFNTSAGGSMACMATYTGSQWTSDQNVFATYELQFS